MLEQAAEAGVEGREVVVALPGDEDLAPRCSSIRTRCCPRNPAPPVTVTRFSAQNSRIGVLQEWESISSVLLSWALPRKCVLQRDVRGQSRSILLDSRSRGADQFERWSRTRSRNWMISRRSSRATNGLINRAIKGVIGNSGSTLSR